LKLFFNQYKVICKSVFVISKEQLDKILSESEIDRVEKTIAKTDMDKFGEAICSFANDLPNHQKPGYLIIGANNDGTRNGTQIDEQFLQTLMGYRTDGRIVPPVSMVVNKFSYPDGDVAVVEVQPSFQPPVRYKGKVCVRIGPRKGTANAEDERLLSEKRSSLARTFDTLPCIDGSIEDLDTNIFRLVYLPVAVDRETLLSNGREIKEQLASLKFYDLRANCPTYAGILMFGKNPRFYLPGAYVQYVRFKGADEISDFDFEQRFTGDLTTQLKIMDDFIKSQIVKYKLTEIGGQYVYNYAGSAVKELLYNAVIHKNYESNAPIKFYEFSDRIEISNAGGLYGKARPENFPNENDYRNPVLAEAAKNLGFVNAFNVGVKRAISALITNGNPAPVFIKDDPTSFAVTIFRKAI
jgi:ATP-dependent DNA helicase RecG